MVTPGTPRVHRHDQGQGPEPLSAKMPQQNTRLLSRSPQSSGDHPALPTKSLSLAPSAPHSFGVPHVARVAVPGIFQASKTCASVPLERLPLHPLSPTVKQIQ